MLGIVGYLGELSVAILCINKVVVYSSILEVEHNDKRKHLSCIRTTKAIQ